MSSAALTLTKMYTDWHSYTGQKKGPPNFTCRAVRLGGNIEIDKPDFCEHATKSPTRTVGAHTS